MKLSQTVDTMIALGETDSRVESINMSNAALQQLSEPKWGPPTSHKQIPDVTRTSPVLKEEKRRKKKKERNQLQRPPHPPLARREAIVRSGNNPLTLTIA